MIAPLMAGMLYCPTFKLSNKTDVWNEQDQKTLRYVADKGCKQQYPDSPCLKIFVKVDEGTYAVICGEMVRRK